MKPYLIIQHQADEGPGRIAEWFAEQQKQARVFYAWQDTVWPNAADLAGVVILGGEANVKDVDSLPWMQKELDWLARALDAGVPCFGICLGAQILAALCGGEVNMLNEPELGPTDVSIQDHKLVKALDVDSLRVVQVHHYHFTIPENAQNLLTSARCPQQLFEHHQLPIMGIQCHLEWSQQQARVLFPTLDDWSSINADDEKRARQLLFILLTRIFNSIVRV